MSFQSSDSNTPYSVVTFWYYWHCQVPCATHFTCCNVWKWKNKKSLSKKPSVVAPNTKINDLIWGKKTNKGEKVIQIDIYMQSNLSRFNYKTQKTNGNTASYESSLCQIANDLTKSSWEISDLPPTNEGVGLS